MPTPPRTAKRQTHTWEVVTSVVAAAFIVLLVSYVIIRNEPLEGDNSALLRILLSLAVSILGATIPGFLSVSWRAGGLLVRACGALALFVLTFFFSPAISNSPGTITVRATLIAESDIPTDRAHVWSTAGGEAKQVSGGWEIEIPLARLPPDRKVTLYAEVPGEFLNGKLDTALVPASQRIFDVTVPLQRQNTASIDGIVVDRGGQPVSGAVISAVGFVGSALTTGDGQFHLGPLGARGQQFLLHVSAPGYRVVTQYHPAGTDPATIVLDAKEQ